ncbi:hypothetical protein PFICI_03441 [Pestalotiopsis fici W106-1]|uniref:O-methyltransferase C-terminal domain-containing protein n=1 Tax=Pestalotiopsis fici (strain W106-1 / CGMCC3.15140) TaxID=1229662 RepID=W3XJL0_PESFW|nr:uncharacterized protein PFICI_03441 [Pestalotiopsis fici W106-1]ETS85416.1 hypothetical protein PFICI_03441 [Pestalotiopsis fici W106-1]
MPTDNIKLLKSIQKDDFPTESDRFEAKEAARALLSRLETPFERAWSLTAEQPMYVAGLLLLKDLGIWTKWADLDREDCPAASRSLTDILAMCTTAVEPNLLLEEVDVDTWKPTAFSLGMGGEIGKMMQMTIDHSWPSGLHLPKFLAKVGYVEPLNLSKFDNYTDVYGLPYWERCEREPEIGGSFWALMGGLTANKMDWTAVYDTNRLVDGADISSAQAPPLFVDVGGLHGLDTNRLLARHPSLPAGILFVQDLPGIVDAQNELDQKAVHEGRPRLDSRISRMKHDFYNPQPLLGARAYFLHAVLHDWPDADCIRIYFVVERIRDAMTKGYSKLLIYEVVLPPKGATSFAGAIDMCLMTMTSGRERTEADWKQMIEAVRLRVVRIDRHDRAVESVIEVELA